ncbi:MAG: aminotransferase class I/II-fold pyridoxal phosphate-dependent enzyme [Planctomycetota bacterium]|nr:aminotransferase class I/II-fold pyridoxal phosphate-dependent enzyme [Planctomycetota bacterium]MDA1138509.1 aminotransferase class I/II-fold pyridoxal phosphate-dependent enzyme [Planctomycetota bacterium]
MSSNENSPLKGMSTRSVHAGEQRDKPQHSLTTPVVFSSTFTFPETEALVAFMEGREERVEEYGRYGNPTRNAVEAKLAALENGQAALLFSSGMAAATTTLLALWQKGSHVIFTNDCYRKTRQFANEVLGKFGIEYDLVAPNADAIEAAIRPETSIIFTESPTNPYMNVIDLVKVVALAEKHQIKTVIDSTFATPYNQLPLDFGVDIVIHSATKYLGGHNDLMAGCVVGRHGIVGLIKDLQSMLGSVADPMSCYLLARGLKTFALRMKQQNENGQKIAEFLESHPKVLRTYYPGLPSHPDHEIATQQMRGFGSVVSFEIDGTIEDGSTFVDATQIPYIAPSLGGVESLIEQPALMSFFELTAEQLEGVGIKQNLIRMAVGIEDAEDLIADLNQALACI